MVAIEVRRFLLSSLVASACLAGCGGGSSGAGTAQVAAPAFSPDGGTFTAAQQVIIASATEGATIRYTTDGSDPSATAGTVYAEPVPVSVSTTIRAVASKDGMADSAVVIRSFTIGDAPQVAAPAFSPDGGTFTAPQQVTITSATEGARIRYTTDGSDPSASAGTVYAGTVQVGTTTTLRAIALKDGMADSSVSAATFTLDLPPVAAPTFSLAGGIYASAQQVSIATSTVGASIRYTTDGSRPSGTTGTAYDGGPIQIGSSTVLRAIAYKAAMADSEVVSRSFTIDASLGVPVFSPVVTYFTPPLTVTLTTRTPGAKIYYTTDGKVPYSTSTLYTGPFQLNASATVGAHAYTSSGQSGGSIIWKKYIAGAPPQVRITGASLSPAAVPLGGSGYVTLAIDVHSDSSTNLSAVMESGRVVQAQNQAWRNMGGAVISCPGNTAGVVPPGDCTSKWLRSFVIANDGSTDGEGLLTPGPAVLELTLMIGSDYLQLFEVPITIVD